ncbi:hypothetical protein ACFXG4_33870 [Nocardia sp. NPDC059246]|uniref:hypothetical protein n=1 Tax=unclassified Nocardia TaxID=2637762 RepID=UPI003687F313
MLAETQNVRVDSEFARLRTVVVSQSEFRAPANAEILGHSMPVEPGAADILNAVWGQHFGAGPGPFLEGKELEGRGITVEYIDFAVSRLFGGAFRCSTQPLLRAD